MTDEISQIKTILKESRRPLIALSENPSYDAISSGLAMYSLCEKIGKKMEIISYDFSPHKNIIFLPKLNAISKNIGKIKNFIISLNLGETKIDNIDYYIKNNELKIFLAPSGGNLQAEDMNFSSSNFKYDTIITLDTEKLENLGPLYKNNLDFFYHTPIINIDHKPENTRFGQINFIDLSSTAISEIIFKMFNDSHHLFDEEIATQFLTGIISKTKSFKTENITPCALDVAGQLISMGAKREEIVNNLYKRQSVPILKLWGRALSELKYDDNIGLVWSVLSREDFIKSGADVKYLKDVIDELIINSPEAKIILLIYEDGDSICCLVRTEKIFNLKKLALELGGNIINNELKFCVKDKNLIEAEEYIIKEIKKDFLS